MSLCLGATNTRVNTVTHPAGSFEPTPRDGALNKMPSDSDPSSSSSGMRPNEDASGASGSSALSLPEEGEDGDGEVESGASEVAEFHAEVLLTAQRWFSAHGWPSGPNPISIPSSLRRYWWCIPGRCMNTRTLKYLG